MKFQVGPRPVGDRLYEGPRVDEYAVDLTSHAARKPHATTPDAETVGVGCTGRHRPGEDDPLGVILAIKQGCSGDIPGSQTDIYFIPPATLPHRLAEGEGDLDPVAALEGVGDVGRARG